MSGWHLKGSRAVTGIRGLASNAPLSAARGLTAWLVVSGVPQQGNHLCPLHCSSASRRSTGGLFVALFAVLGELLQPKRFAGIFGASPAVALGNLLVIALAEGEASARVSVTGMIAGAVALAVACTAAIPAVRRWGTVWGSAVLWTVWLTVGGAIAQDDLRRQVVAVMHTELTYARRSLPCARPGRLDLDRSRVWPS